MKKTILISATALFLFSCTDEAKQKEMSDYAADVCACAFASTNKEEFDKCNTQREEFFTKFNLDVDDDDANRMNDMMYDCISEHRKD